MNVKKLLSREEYRQIQINILSEVAKICEEHKLSYYLGYGTMLGAIRHKGFIPWDDDIDLLFPYDELEKLMEIFPCQTGSSI